MSKINVDDTIKALSKGMVNVEPIVKGSFGRDKGVILDNGKVTNFNSGILSDINYDDYYADCAVKLLDSTLKRVYSDAGASLTLAAVLTTSLTRAVGRLHAANYDFKKVTKWLDIIGSDFDEYIVDRAKKVNSLTWEGNEKFILSGIATTACGSEKIGNLIGEMCFAIGKHSHINLVEKDLPDVQIDYTNGFSFDTEVLSKHFDIGLRKEFVEPKVLVADIKLDNVQAIINVIVFCNKRNRPLIIIASSISEDVLALLIHNLNIGSLDVAVIKVPSFANERFAALRDIIEVTGGFIVDKFVSSKLTAECLGGAAKITISEDTCSIVPYAPASDEYIKKIEDKLPHASSSDKFKLRRRISNLREKAATIKIGGYTDIDKKANYYIIESTVHAVRGAMHEGYIPGGYQIFYDFYRAARRPEIPDVIYQHFLAPYTFLMENYRDSLPAEKYISEDPTCLFDLKYAKIRSITECGVIDSVKAIRVATKAAVSTVKTFTTTGAIVVNR